MFRICLQLRFLVLSTLSLNPSSPNSNIPITATSPHPSVFKVAYITPPVHSESIIKTLRDAQLNIAWTSGENYFGTHGYVWAVHPRQVAEDKWHDKLLHLHGPQESAQWWSQALNIRVMRTGIYVAKLASWRCAERLGKTWKTAVLHPISCC